MDRDTERRISSEILDLGYNDLPELRGLVNRVKEIIGPACEACRARNALTTCLQCGGAMRLGVGCERCGVTYEAPRTFSAEEHDEMQRRIRQRRER